MTTQPESVVNMTSETTPTVSPYSTTESITQLISTVETQQAQHRNLHRHLKKLEKDLIKEHKRLSKVSRPRRKVVQNPVKVSKAMIKFMKKMDVVEHENGGWTRMVMMKAVSAYVKSEDLQVEGARKNWKPDSTLTKLFKLDNDQNYSFININGLITKVVEK